MTVVNKIATSNAILDTDDALFPSGSTLELRTGSAAGPDNAASGTLIATYTTSGWAAAASRSKAKSGTLSVASAASGTLAHWRLKNAGDTHRREGTITATGGGGDMTVDNTAVVTPQTVVVNTLTTSIN